MSLKRVFFVLSLAALSGVCMAKAQEFAGAVFTMTNSANGNQIVSYDRESNGSLIEGGTYSTDGEGSGGTVDPLKSQGALALNADHSLLFAVNAGSNSISTFSVEGSWLTLLSVTPSGGTMPTSIAQYGNLLYVLNAGGNGNITGFRIGWKGKLEHIPGSTRALSSNSSVPTSITFSPYGQYLAVTELNTNTIDVFAIDQNGAPSSVVESPSVDQEPFAVAFTWNGQLLVASASNFVSSYSIGPAGTLSTITASLPTLGMATCWNVVTPNGLYTYTDNAKTGTISGYWISPAGALTPLTGTIVATEPTGSGNLDMAMSGDGKYLYTLNAGTGAIGILKAGSGGSLGTPKVILGLPAAGGIQGIAAY